MPRMLTIKGAAEATGVPEASLRAWEQRYGLAPSARTPAGYRLYDEVALGRIREVKRLVAAGWTPKQASAAVLAHPEGRMNLTTAVRPFVDAVAAMDDGAAEAVLADAWSRAPFERVVDEWLLPVLGEVGNRWKRGDLDIAAEHLAAAILQRRLMVELDAARTWSRDQRVLIGLGPGARHEIGIATFAACAGRAGLDLRYFGADLPPSGWCRAVREMNAAAIVVGVPLATDVIGVRAVVDAVHAEHPSVVVAVGGSHQDEVGDPAVPLGHDMHEGVRRLAALLADRTRTRVA